MSESLRPRGRAGEDLVVITKSYELVRERGKTPPPAPPPKGEG